LVVAAGPLFSTTTTELTSEVCSYKVTFDGYLCVEKSEILNNSWTNLLEEKLALSLSNATQGRHTLRVDVNLEYTVVATGLAVLHAHSETSASVDFYVYRGIPPEVSLSDPDVKSDQTVFKIETNDPDSTISYSLDGGANVTLSKNQSVPFQGKNTYNVTLVGLYGDVHTLRVYAKDVFNNTAVAEKVFTLEAPIFLTVVVTTGVILISVAVVVLLLKRRSRQKVLVKG
jgi:hypothetical protein